MNAFSALKKLYLLKLNYNPVSKTFRKPKAILFRNGVKLFKSSWKYVASFLIFYSTVLYILKLFGFKINFWTIVKPFIVLFSLVVVIPAVYKWFIPVCLCFVYMGWKFLGFVFGPR
jgi:hypothetical protein